MAHLFGFSLDELMQTYQSAYSTNILIMDMQLNYHLSGDSKAATRQFIAESLTGKKLAPGKCTVGFLSPLMKAYYEQPKLF